MKKLFVTFLVAVAAIALWSCGGVENTPKGVAEASIKCMQNEDIKGYVDLLYFDDSKNKGSEQEKEKFAEIIKGKVLVSLKEKEGIKSYETLSEEISENGNSAKVKMKITYGNGEESNQTFKLLKDKEGKWKIKFGK